jgi:hypothetical protein
VAAVDPELTGTTLALAACVLVATGVAKLRAPAAAASALGLLGIPGGRAAARALGACEAALGALLLAAPSRPAAAAAGGAFIAFAAAVLVVARRSGGSASCGCLGSADAPAHPSHVAIDIALAGAALAAVVTPPTAAASLAAATPVAGIPWLAGVVVAAWLVLVAMERLPALAGVYRAEPPGGSA